MKILLDTHAFLWALVEPNKLSPKTRQLFEEDSTDVFVSAASAWEIATKIRLGKLSDVKGVVADYAEALHGLQAMQLDTTSDHARKAESWKVEHRDPSDRMLAAQSALEKLALVSCDPAMKQFGIQVIW